MKYIVIDFDGTCVTHMYPLLGRDIGAQRVLRRLVECGHKLILFTMRGNQVTEHEEVINQNGIAVKITRSSNKLQDAVNWFKLNKIPLYGIQTNPTQSRWTDSPKAYGHMIIDDAALGCPLIDNGVDRPYVDWDKVESMLIENGSII